LEKAAIEKCIEAAVQLTNISRYASPQAYILTWKDWLERH
jgi:hypothetical protein